MLNLILADCKIDCPFAFLINIYAAFFALLSFRRCNIHILHKTYRLSATPSPHLPFFLFAFELLSVS